MTYSDIMSSSSSDVIGWLSWIGLIGGVVTGVCEITLIGVVLTGAKCSDLVGVAPGGFDIGTGGFFAIN